jgi:hypothetical protein
MRLQVALLAGMTGIPFEAVVFGAPAGVSLDPCGDGTLVVCGGCFRLAGLARRDQQQLQATHDPDIYPLTTTVFFVALPNTLYC